MTNLELVLDELAAAAPVDEQDWDDVVSRAGRPRRRRLGVATVALVTMLVVVVMPAFGVGSTLLDLFRGTPVSGEQLSAADLHAMSAMANAASPRVSVSREEDLSRLSPASLRQIADREGRAFLVADLKGGGLCASIGLSGDTPTLGAISCSPDFPSAARPILDESRFTGRVDEPRIAVLQGFAADAVASIAVVSLDGEPTVTTPVEHNVYLRTEGLPSGRSREIVALDSGGRRLYVECLVAGGCST